MLIGHYVPMLVFGCLGQIVPERVMAACGSPMWGMNQSGVRPDGKGGGKPYANMFFYNGGMGGNTQRDGITCLSWPSNVSSTSIEISEHIAPLRFHHKKLRPDSGGAGRHRGGLGQEILIESRSERRSPSPSSPSARSSRPSASRAAGRRARRAAHQRRQDRSQEAVRAAEGRHRLARHAGRRRTWRSAAALQSGGGRGHCCGYVMEKSATESSRYGGAFGHGARHDLASRQIGASLLNAESQTHRLILRTPTGRVSRM
jgi:N-methylhydantoinase B/oxoprolinase/acetone carboxylase alpha subunit